MFLVIGGNVLAFLLSSLITGEDSRCAPRSANHPVAALASSGSPIAAASSTGAYAFHSTAASTSSTRTAASTSSVAEYVGKRWLPASTPRTAAVSTHPSEATTSVVSHSAALNSR